MSDIETLHGRLHSLVHVPASISGRERVLANVGENDVLEAMRLEISETQLARRVTFRSDRNKEISFEVASGRIFKLVEPTSSSLFIRLESKNLIDTLLEQDGTATCLPELISLFISGAKTLKVETQFLREPVKSPSFGIPAKAVFTAPCTSDREPHDPSECDVLVTFLKTSSAFAIAGLITLEHSETFEFGRQDDLALLRKFLLAKTSQGANSPLMQSASENDNHCVVYSGHPKGANSILCAVQAKSLAMVLFESAHLDKMLKLAKF